MKTSLQSQITSNFFESFIEKTSSPTLIITRNKIIECNSAALSFFNIKNLEKNYTFNNLYLKKFKGNTLNICDLNTELSQTITKGNHSFTSTYKTKENDFLYFQFQLTSISKFNGQEVIYITINNVTETKQEQNNILNRLKAVEESSNSIIITDSNGNMEYVNKAVLENTGFKKEEVIGKNPKIFKSNKNNTVDYKNLWETITNGEIWKGEFCNISKNGKHFWEHATITPIHNSNGELESFIGVKENITSLKESEELLSNIINSSPNIVYYINNKLKYLKVNKKFEEVFDVSKDEIVGKTNDYLHNFAKNNTFIKLLEETTKQVILQKKTIIKEHFCNEFQKDFEIIKVPSFDSGKEVKGVVTIIKDISIQKNKEKELINIKTLLDETGKMAKVGGWKYNLITKSLICTKETSNIHGLDPDYILDIGNSLKYYKNDSKKILINELDQLLNYSEPYDLELEFIDNNNVEKWVRTKGIPIIEDGELTSIYGTLQDITEKKQNELALLEAKKNAEKSNKLKTEFLQNLSHEIRTPMNGILGFSDLIETSNLDPKSINYLNIVRNSGKHLLSIIDDLLEISFLETKQVKLKEEEFNLNDFLVEVHTMFDVKVREKSISLYLEKGFGDNKSCIKTDKTKLFKVLNNLLKNAIKYTNKGSISLGYKLDKGKIQFYVKDTGIGIEKDKFEIIFERFSRAQSKTTHYTRGLGLGLSIAKENVELLGSELKVESTVGVGSVFSFHIPCKCKSDIEFIEKDIAKTNKKTIMIVENDEINYLYLEILLEDYDSNLNILHAKNGLRAVELSKTHNIEFILMDIMMPEMNGLEATEIIKKEFKHIPIIAQTALSTETEIKKIMAHSFDDYITKPIEADALKEKLKKYFPIINN